MTPEQVQAARNIHVIGALVAGGAERFIVDLLIAMKQQGGSPELVCLMPKRDSVGELWASQLSEAGVPIHDSPAGSLKPTIVRWLSKKLGGAPGGIVHIHLYNVEIAYYLARFLHRRRYAVVRTVHNTSMPEGRLSWWAFDHSDIRHSITCGEATEQAYEGLLPGEHICVPYGVSFDWPRHDPTQRNERLRALGLDPQHTHFMQVGRMTGESLAKNQKAQDDLITAWRRGKLGDAGGRLHLLGDGNLRAECESIAGDDGSVHMPGVVSNVKEWLGACDTYVMPSRWEGLPLAGIEACGTGIPAVFSEIPPLRELAYDASVFFPLGDIDALAGCLRERIGARDTASEAEVDRIRDMYGVDRPAREYLKFYEQLT
jgi:glycosyltransferase involved in cell wall biosynthesis